MVPRTILGGLCVLGFLVIGAAAMFIAGWPEDPPPKPSLGEQCTAYAFECAGPVGCAGLPPDEIYDRGSYWTRHTRNGIDVSIDHGATWKPIYIVETQKKIEMSSDGRIRWTEEQPEPSP